jgi:hypothetical protein
VFLGPAKNATRKHHFLICGNDFGSGRILHTQGSSLTAEGAQLDGVCYERTGAEGEHQREL